MGPKAKNYQSVDKNTQTDRNHKRLTSHPSSGHLCCMCEIMQVMLPWGRLHMSWLIPPLSANATLLYSYSKQKFSYLDFLLTREIIHSRGYIQLRSNLQLRMLSGEKILTHCVLLHFFFISLFLFFPSHEEKTWGTRQLAMSRTDSQEARRVTENKFAQ